MKRERIPALACRAICSLGAFVVVAGTSAALAQAPAAKPPSIDKKHSMMPGMAPGGDMQGSMKGMMKHMDSMKMTGQGVRPVARQAQMSSPRAA